MDPNELQRLLVNMIRLGTVAELDTAAARCRIQTGEILTDFVPWIVPRAGTTIEWSAPAIGEQVLLISLGGDTHGAVALRGVYSDSFAAPESSAARHLVQYQDGAVIEYDHDAHALKATLPAGGTAEITADGGVTINGPLTVNGDTEINGDTQVNGDTGCTGTVTGDTDVIAAGISGKGHKHPGVQSGGAQTGGPV